MIQEKFLTDVCVSNRQQIGERIGVIGITVNSFLFAIKLTLGLLNNSVSVIADGFNNLGDSVSSLVTTIGFHLSGKTTDEKHPYGYGRMEYISGFVVAMLIIVTAISVGKSSIVRILHPESPTLTAWLFFAQVFAVFVKLLFALYIHVINSRFDSAALKATLKDSLADSVVTTVTLLSLITSRYTALPIDGIGGLIVAIMILWAGITSFKEHLDLLLGKPVSKETLDEISNVINKYDFFSGMKALYLYDFGPEKQIAYLKIVPKVSPHFKEVQNAINELTTQLKRDYNLEVTIYWDTNHIENNNVRKEHTDGSSNRFQGKLPKKHSSN